AGRPAAGHQTGGYGQMLAATPLVAGTWTHLAVTYDSVTQIMNLYQNGILVATATSVPGYTEPSLDLGTFAAGNYYSGRMDEVRLWSVARTAAEIAADMNCALTGDEFFLLAYYNFNEGVPGANNAGINILPDVQDDCTHDNGLLVNFALNGPTSNWVAPGAAIATTCAGNFENITVSGNANCIESGDVTPSLTDFTDFGDIG